jgi:hypothetical protein
MEEPAGFGIRYIWTAQADGPALQSGLKSREYITPYRPIIVSVQGMESNINVIQYSLKLTFNIKIRNGYTKQP